MFCTIVEPRSPTSASANYLRIGPPPRVGNATSAGPTSAWTGVAADHRASVLTTAPLARTPRSAGRSGVDAAAARTGSLGPQEFVSVRVRS
jgi:hypothetical protein